MLLQTDHALTLQLSGAPSAAWTYGITYESHGQVGGGLKSVTGTIPAGTAVIAIEAPDGYAIRMIDVKMINVSNLGNAALTLTIRDTDGVTPIVIDQHLVEVGDSYQYLSSGVATTALEQSQDTFGIQRLETDFSAADIVGLGAMVSESLLVGELPAGAVVLGRSIKNLGTVGATLTSLTATLGTNGAMYDDISAAQSVFDPDEGISGPAIVAGLDNSVAATDVYTVITGNANLDTLTGLDDGIRLTVFYMLAS